MKKSTQRRFRVGVGTGRAAYTGLLASNFTNVAHPGGAAPIEMHIHALPAGLFLRNGTTLRALAKVWVGSTGGTGFLRWRLNSVTLMDCLNFSPDSSGYMRVILSRVSSTQFKCLGEFIGVGVPGIVLNVVVPTTFDPTVDNTLSLRGSFDNPDELNVEWSFVEVLS